MLAIIIILGAWLIYMLWSRRYYSLDMRLERALRELETGNVGKAIESVERILRDFPDSVKTHKALARLYETDHRFDDAVKLLERLIELSPEYEHLEYLETQARLHTKSGKLESAEAVLRQLCEYEPDSFRYHMELTSILLGMEKWDEGVKVLQIASGLSPDNPVLEMRLGVAYLRNGQIDKSLQTFNKLVADDPHRITARYHIAEIHQMNGCWEEALAELKVILKTARGRLKICSCMNAGNCCMELKDGQKAVAYYKQGASLTSDPELSEEFRYNIGLATQLFALEEAGKATGTSEADTGEAAGTSEADTGEAAGTSEAETGEAAGTSEADTGEATGTDYNTGEVDKNAYA